MNKKNNLMSQYDKLNIVWQSFKELITNQKDMVSIQRECFETSEISFPTLLRYLVILENLFKGKQEIPNLKTHELDFFIKRFKGDFSNNVFYDVIKTIDNALLHYDNQNSDINKYQELTKLIHKFYFSRSLMKSDIDVLNIIKEKSNEPMMFRIKDLPVPEHYLTRIYGYTIEELVNHLNESGVEYDRDEVKILFIIESACNQEVTHIENSFRKLTSISNKLAKAQTGMFINKNLDQNLYYLILFHDPSITPPVNG